MYAAYPACGETISMFQICDAQVVLVQLCYCTKVHPLDKKYILFLDQNQNIF